MQQTPRDEALERFDKLCMRVVYARYKDTALDFLARFQSAAARLRPEDRIKLVFYTYSDITLLKAVLGDPQASKICALFWTYYGKGDVNSVIPLLLSDCPKLVSLQVDFKHYSAFDFVSSLLEHPDNKLKVLVMPRYTKGSIPRFFAALGQSQVSALTIYSDDSPEFYQGLCEYLAKDLLVRLDVDIGFKQVLSGMMMSLAMCNCLAKLEMSMCEFLQPTAFTRLPKSITKLVFHDSQFVGGFDWSFLADSNVRELGFHNVVEVEGNQLGSALAAHLRAKGLDKLHAFDCYFINEALAAVGVEIGQIKRLVLEQSDMDNASIAQIAIALQSPNNEMKDLRLDFEWTTARNVKKHVMPALKHPNCNLTKLSFLADEPEYKAAAKVLEDRFHNRRTLFVLLEGQQVRRVYCPLRRLPVEMFRLVGEVLL